MTTTKKVDLETLVLKKGSHSSPSTGLCFAEAAAYFAGRPHTDHPPCVSPAIAAFGRSWNDSLNDTDRQMLKPYILRVLNTATTPADEERRAWLATDWLVREFTPTWLDLAGLTDHAAKLRALPELTSTDLANAALPVINDARRASDAAGDAAGAAARDAAWAAARAAARDAAGAAARAAARAAAGAALQPTVAALQASALELLDKMIAVGKTEPAQKVAA